MANLTVNCDAEPTPDPLVGVHGTVCEIENTGSTAVTITFSANGLVVPSPQRQVTVPAKSGDTNGSWSGQFGNTVETGTFSYPECGEALVPRTGTIRVT